MLAMSIISIVIAVGTFIFSVLTFWFNKDTKRSLLLGRLEKIKGTEFSISLEFLNKREENLIRNKDEILFDEEMGGNPDLYLFKVGETSLQDAVEFNKEVDYYFTKLNEYICNMPSVSTKSFNKWWTYINKFELVLNDRKKTIVNLEDTHFCVKNKGKFKHIFGQMNFKEINFFVRKYLVFNASNKMDIDELIDGIDKKPRKIGIEDILHGIELEFGYSVFSPEYNAIIRLNKNQSTLPSAAMDLFKTIDDETAKGKTIKKGKEVVEALAPLVAIRLNELFKEKNPPVLMFNSVCSKHGNDSIVCWKYDESWKEMRCINLNHKSHKSNGKEYLELTLNSKPEEVAKLTRAVKVSKFSIPFNATVDMAVKHVDKISETISKEILNALVKASNKYKDNFKDNSNKLEDSPFYSDYMDDLDYISYIEQSTNWKPGKSIYKK